MKIQIAVLEVVVGLIVGAWLAWAFTTLYMADDVERLKSQALSLSAKIMIEKMSCPENIFQEKTITTPEGGVFKCGAIRELPVDKKELARWYRAEAKNLLKNSAAKGGRKK